MSTVTLPPVTKAHCEPAVPVKDTSSTMKSSVLTAGFEATVMGDILNLESKHSIVGAPSQNVVMVRGQGAYLWDMNGKKYIDFNAGFSACNQGHCHPRIVQAMVQQCQQLSMPSRSVHNAPYAAFAKRICELTGYDKIAMMNGGAEATDQAMKLARTWGYTVKGISPDQALILTAVSGYHGRTLSLLSASDIDAYRKNNGPWMPNVGPSCAGMPVRFGEIDDLKRAFEKCGPQIAAFMIEPVQGHAGCLPPPEDYLRQVRELCTIHNVLLIADEIQAGLGRTGAFLSNTPYDMKPDMVVLGKSMSGGLYPISAVLGTNEVMTTIEVGQYGSTFATNPLACAVADAALDVIIDEDLPGRAASLSASFAARLNAMQSPYFDKITGKGLFISLYIHETHPQGRVTGARLEKLCLQRGLLLNAAGRRLRVCPALVIQEETMLEGVDIIEQALRDLPDMDEV